MHGVALPPNATCGTTLAEVDCMNNPTTDEQIDDRDLEIGRPHGPREDEEERDGLRVSSNPMRDEEEEMELQDEDLLFDDDEDLADEGDLDFEPEDGR
jgi:hypothetical protein